MSNIGSYELKVAEARKECLILREAILRAKTFREVEDWSYQLKLAEIELDAARTALRTAQSINNTALSGSYGVKKLNDFNSGLNSFNSLPTNQSSYTTPYTSYSSPYSENVTSTTQGSYTSQGNYLPASNASSSSTNQESYSYTSYASPYNGNTPSTTQGSFSSQGSNLPANSGSSTSTNQGSSYSYTKYASPYNQNVSSNFDMSFENIKKSSNFKVMETDVVTPDGKITTHKGLYVPMTANKGLLLPPDFFINMEATSKSQTSHTPSYYSPYSGTASSTQGNYSSGFSGTNSISKPSYTTSSKIQGNNPSSYSATTSTSQPKYASTSNGTSSSTASNSSSNTETTTSSQSSFTSGSDFVFPNFASKMKSSRTVVYK